MNKHGNRNRETQVISLALYKKHRIRLLSSHTAEYAWHIMPKREMPISQHTLFCMCSYQHQLYLLVSPLQVSVILALETQQACSHPWRSIAFQSQA